MSLGLDIIAELSRRGERGRYFDYSGYRTLRRIASVDDLAAFLSEREFSPEIAFNDPVQVAEALRGAVAERESDWDVFGWIACDPLCGMLALPFWLIYRSVRRANRNVDC